MLSKTARYHLVLINGDVWNVFLNVNTSINIFALDHQVYDLILLANYCDDWSPSVKLFPLCCATGLKNSRGVNNLLLCTVFTTVFPMQVILRALFYSVLWKKTSIVWKVWYCILVSPYCYVELRQMNAFSILNNPWNNTTILP